MVSGCILRVLTDRPTDSLASAEASLAPSARAWSSASAASSCRRLSGIAVEARRYHSQR
jgi:hypothetical protein